MIIHLTVENEAQTNALAQKISNFVCPGDVLRLEGTLGAGKTTFARAFIQAFAGEEITVPSPTFSLVQTYDATRLPVAHIDAYRMNSPEEMETLEINDYFDSGVTLVEWSEKIEAFLPTHHLPEGFAIESEFPDVLTILIEELPENETARKITLEASGTWGHRLGLIDDSASRQQTEENRIAFLNENSIDYDTLSFVAGDCSYRKYYRVEKEGAEPRIIMDAPPPMEDVSFFVRMTKLWENLGIRAPKIYTEDTENGYLLIEDMGADTLNQAFAKGAEKMPWLEKSVDLLAHIANKGEIDGTITYTAATPFAEASRYVDWYLPCTTGHATHPADRKEFSDIWKNMYAAVTKVPPMLSHWDYHCDNLMMCCTSSAPSSIQEIGVIDYQDCRMAPISFDIACLLEDRHATPLTDAEKEHLISRFLEALEVDVSREEFMTSYRLVLIHRLLKIVGLYMRITTRTDRTDLPWNMEDVWAKINKLLDEEPAAADLKTFISRMNTLKGAA